MARVNVRDSLGLLKPLFTSRLRPAERFEVARAQLLDPRGGLSPMMHWLGQSRQSVRYQVIEVAQLDGVDAAVGQQAWGLFNPTRNPDLTDWQFAEYARLSVDERARAVAERILLALGEAAPDELTITLVPIDAANANAMRTCHGLSYFPTPEGLLLSIWPTETSLTRLEPALSRDLARVARLNLQPEPTTLRDFIAFEGLAASFVAQQSPNLPSPWLAPFQPPPEWDADLAHVASFYGAASYDDLTFNVYGATQQAGSRLPQPTQPLQPDELAYSHDVIAEALDTPAPASIAAHLYGDAVLAASGHPTVGLSPFAGFEVAYHLIQARLGELQLTVKEAIGLPSNTLVPLTTA